MNAWPCTCFSFEDRSSRSLCLKFNRLAKLNRAPGNDEPIGGIKIATANGWFAARPSGTEEVYKLYAESFVSLEHLRAVQRDAQAFVSRCFGEQLSVS